MGNVPTDLPKNQFELGINTRNLYLNGSPPATAINLLRETTTDCWVVTIRGPEGFECIIEGRSLPGNLIANSPALCAAEIHLID